MCTLLEQALVKCRKTIVNFFFYVICINQEEQKQKNQEL